MSNQSQKIDWSKFIDPEDIEEEEESEEYFDPYKEYGLTQADFVYPD